MVALSSTPDITPSVDQMSRDRTIRPVPARGVLVRYGHHCGHMPGCWHAPLYGRFHSLSGRLVDNDITDLQHRYLRDFALFGIYGKVALTMPKREEVYHGFV